jgi:hypothetical protein
MNHALELGGLSLMVLKPDGSECCPLCEAWDHRHDGREDEPEVTEESFERYWIIGPTDSAYHRCQELGLISKQ